MNVMGNYFAIAIVAFLSGAFLGALIYRLFQGDAGKSRRVEQQMDDLQQKHTQYQAQVSEHFLQTAHLIKRINDDYHAINTHLAKGAMELCSEDNASELKALSSGDNQESILEVDKETEEESHVEPPRDYAPKSETDKGTLSEDFGFKAKTKAESE